MGATKSPSKREPTCNACRFWDPRCTHAGLGECRRYPPQHAFEPQGGSGRVSPVTGAYFWCGEHQPSGGKVATGQDRHHDDFVAQGGSL